MTARFEVVPHFSLGPLRLAVAGHQVQAGHPKNRDDAGTRFLPALNLCLWSNLRNVVDEVSIFTDRHWDG